MGSERGLHPPFLGGNPLPLAPDGLQEVMSESRWSVYSILCGDGSLYTGIATDVERLTRMAPSSVTLAVIPLVLVSVKRETALPFVVQIADTTGSSGKR
jgi:hypothetical protein